MTGSSLVWVGIVQTVLNLLLQCAFREVGTGRSEAFSTMLEVYFVGVPQRMPHTPFVLQSALSSQCVGPGGLGGTHAHA